MFSSFVFVFLFTTPWFHRSTASRCSQLDLSQTNLAPDDIFTIEIKKIPSSNLIEVSMVRTTLSKETVWFLMGARHENRLVGSWQPFSSADGEVIDCSSLEINDYPEQLVISKNFTQYQSKFYWMPPESFGGTVAFLSRLFFDDASGGFSSYKYVESESVSISLSLDRHRFQDVNRSQFPL